MRARAAAPVLSVSPQALADFLTAAHVQVQGPAPPPEPVMNPAVATLVAVAGVASVGVCAALMRPAIAPSPQGRVARWAVTAPLLWAGSHWLAPSWSPAVDVLATAGVGFAMFTVGCLASRQLQGPGVRQVPGAHVAVAALAAACIAVMWHDAALPSSHL